MSSCWRCSWWIGCVWILWIGAGCTRTHYRLDADTETYCIIHEKTAGTPWNPPPAYSIEPDARSRLYDPTSPDDPLLPIPAPRLYAYHLPDLPARDPNRFQKSGLSHDAPDTETPPDAAPVSTDLDLGKSLIQLAGFQQEPATANLEQVPDRLEPDFSGSDSSETGFVVRPIPESVWESLPAGCLTRMFEFPSVREEYTRSWEQPPAPQQRDASPRLALEDILDLALLNSRAYQAQKENLYRAALRLSLERYDYLLKFSTSGNGSGAFYSHDRNRGITNNRLAIPTTITGDKVLATGGDLLARFANDVVLTFNGPDGFAADVGSELLLDISQSVLQRDIVFERLTQAERDVVYAARDFARFRKQFFRDLTVQYYSLILTYRGIEIDAQDYFSNLRAYEQGYAEYRAGQRSRIEVDQIEQNVLAGRSSLIASCNSLESGLDQLKLRIGLPPELPINLDLSELEILTLRDESTVSGELVRRARRNLVSERNMDSPDRSVLLNFAIDLSRRMLDLSELRKRLGVTDQDVQAIRILLTRLLADEAGILVEFNLNVLTQEKQATHPAPPVRIFQRTMDSVDSLLKMIDRDLELATRLSANPEAIQSFQKQVQVLRDRHGLVRDDLEEAVANRQLDRVQPLIQEAEDVLNHAIPLSHEVRTLIGKVSLTKEQALNKTLEQAEWLLGASDRMLADEMVGLLTIDIDMDDAMLTALVQRFDLMNERGALADTWRHIKLAGDDLRSVMNLNASQVIRTRSDVNRPFDFTFDDSQTQLSLSLDTPFNRKSQRNSFRQSLINYEAALRNLTELEDNIKLEIRDDLRQLQLDREQYQIAVASAALAYERVVSTRWQLQLGIQNVSARDFLESQQDYTASLIAVARQHIGYLSDRIQLFLDLELLEIDTNGFWPELYNEEYQPMADFLWPGNAWPAYGTLPGNVRYSGKMQRMLCVPSGQPSKNGTPEHVAGGSSSENGVSATKGPFLEEIPAPTPQEKP